MLDESAWLAICFIIFLGLFYRPIKKALLNFLDERIKQIAWEIDSANLTKENSAKELQELKNHLQSIEKKHQEMIQAAEIEIEKSFEDRCKKFEKSLEYKENAALGYMDQMRKNTMAEMEKELLDKVLNLVSNYFNEQKSNALDLTIISANTLKRQKR